MPGDSLADSTTNGNTKKAPVTGAVIGTGAWGTTLALLLAGKGYSTWLWEHRPERAAQFEEERENTTFLAGYPFPPSLHVTADIAQAVGQAGIVIFATPSQRLRENIRTARPYLRPDALLVTASKGLEKETLKRMSEVLVDEAPPALSERVLALSGPNISREIAGGLPAAAVVAARDQALADQARDLLSTAAFRVYSSDDVLGVELAGALKNIIALGAGMSDGFGFGDNAKASLLTRGLAEIARLGQAAGANPLTFLGLAGIGDLVTTCASRHSRNRFVGEELARGRALADIQATMNSVAEGITTTQVARTLAARYQVELPITEQMYQVLFAGKSPREAVSHLMMRDRKPERQGLAFPTDEAPTIIQG